MTLYNLIIYIICNNTILFFSPLKDVDIFLYICQQSYSLCCSQSKNHIPIVNPTNRSLLFSTFNGNKILRSTCLIHLYLNGWILIHSWTCMCIHLHTNAHKYTHFPLFTSHFPVFTAAN